METAAAPVSDGSIPFKGAATWYRVVGEREEPGRRPLVCLHGGPGGAHDYLEPLGGLARGRRVIFYDQLGCGRSPYPEDPSLWTVELFVEELGAVRDALGLDQIHLFGSSWGGMLAMEYALTYQAHLKGLVISNMMASIPQYNEYARNVLMPAMDQKVLAEVKQLEAAGKYEDPRYMELLIPSHYSQHILRLPPDQWPDPVNRAFKHINPKIYVPMQGPSELGASGKLLNWDRSADLKNIAVPTLVIGARYDTMDPKHMEWMSKQFPKGRYLYCPNGSHLAEYDDQDTYFKGLIEFVRSVDAGNR